MRRLKTSVSLFAFVICVLGPCIFAPRLSSQDSSALAEHLWQIAKAEFRDIPITAEAANACKQFIANGAPKVEDKAVAERDVRKLADEMVRQASYDESIRSKQIDLAAFNRARNLLCPLYPFC